MMATHHGFAIRFNEKDVRAMGRTAHGVHGINLRAGDVVVAMDTVEGDTTEVLSVSENGYGKCSNLELYRGQTRGGKGRINYKVTDTNRFSSWHVRCSSWRRFVLDYG
jgi:DNA gyrase subunit A